MVLVEDLGGAVELQAVVRARAPGQLRDPLQVGADHLGLHRLAPGALQAAQLALDLLPRLLGEGEGAELLAERLQLLGRVVVAELLLDRLHLLAQEHLALALAELLLDGALDVLLRLQQADLALDEDEHLAHALLDREGLEEALLLRDGELDVAGHEIGELAGLGDRVQHLVHDLLGEAAALAEFGGALARLFVERLERRVLVVEREHLLGLDRDGLEVPVGGGVLQGRGALLPREQELHAAQAALDLPDAGDHAGGVEVLRAGLVGVVALGDGEDGALVLERRLDRAQCPGAAGRDRLGDAGEDDRPAQRQDGESLAVRHAVWDRMLGASGRGRRRAGARRSGPRRTLRSCRADNAGCAHGPCATLAGVGPGRPAVVSHPAGPAAGTARRVRRFRSVPRPAALLH